ncbi:glutamate--cysteine ligase [Pseudarthrobacter sp. NPDC058329]|uniref:glutamate--cysteine ligase n=1 Tax=Pseudarthrobacter sp. NPDC058329 TaxID=3346448 RepID=UPI0036DCDB8D
MKPLQDQPYSSSAVGLQRTFGVEEEFLLVDPASGQPVPVAERALRHVTRNPGTAGGPTLALEVKQEQLEVIGPVCSRLQQLAEAILLGRMMADTAARAVGARAVALATSPLSATSTLVQQPRYLKMAARFHLTLREQLTCGFHVHVHVASGEEGVAVLDRIRRWLPVVLALSANSPFWQGTNTGYSSFRYQAWSRWPTAGPYEQFGSLREYRRHVEALLASGVLLDEGMVYFDARLSRSHPTVEVRIADVCLEAAHATILAAVVRALVERAAQEWWAGVPAPRLPAEQLRLASWMASDAGVEGNLMHPLMYVPCPATEAVQALLTHIRPALVSSGDEEYVRLGLAGILAFGTGSHLQRAAMVSSQSLAAVVMDAVERTHGTATETPGRARHLHST